MKKVDEESTHLFLAVVFVICIGLSFSFGVTCGRDQFSMKEGEYDGKMIAWNLDREDTVKTYYLIGYADAAMGCKPRGEQLAKDFAKP